VFELIPNTTRTQWTEKVLYSFCARGGTSCTDGSSPAADLIIDKAGHLYGTTLDGGLNNEGVVFELTPNAAGTQWAETVLHSFCAQVACADGAFPEGGLIMDKEGRLYGTTFGGGGTTEFAGTVFELAPNAARTRWTETVLYIFCSQPGCIDGSGPVSGLLMDSAGHLYGTTQDGGTHGQYEGTVFELIPNSARTQWSEKVLYSFCARGGTSCSDGAQPGSGLIMVSGHLYGTTAEGGAHDAGDPRNPGGTVFELTPNAAGTQWTETVLHSFCAQVACADGANPTSGNLIEDVGHLYGTTSGGGAHAAGMAFELTANAAGTQWAETVLHSFCAQPNCTDGQSPAGGLLMDSAGHLYGTTYLGGAPLAGTVFEVP
jgi:uncharacterized repeat protein (TIGR03803 family)